jgi:hypothetical protein
LGFILWIRFLFVFCYKYENGSGFWTAAILTYEEWVSFVSGLLARGGGIGRVDRQSEGNQPAHGIWYWLCTIFK